MQIILETIWIKPDIVMESVKYERGNFEITEITKILMSQPKTKRREKSPNTAEQKNNAAQITLNCDID